MQIGMRGFQYEGCLKFFSEGQPLLSDIPNVIDYVLLFHWIVNVQ